MSAHDLIGDAVPPTDRAREAFRAAWEEAIRLGHDIVVPQHIMLGVLAGRPAVATSVIEQLQASLDELRAVCRATLPPSGIPGQFRELPYSSEAVSVIHTAMKTARSAGAADMSSGHVLLGVAEALNAVTPGLLEVLDTDLGDLQARILAVAPDVAASEYGD